MRFKALTESNMTQAQRTVYREICSGPRARSGPPGNRGTEVLLRSPELASAVQKVGAYLRYGSSLPPRISEFAILITARHWSAQYEWHAHYAIALKAGLRPELIAELAQGKRPSSMQEDEAAAYEFSTELQRTKQVSDAAFDAAVQHFGEQGVADLIGIAGYYTLISMVLNVNQAPLPDGVSPPLPPLP